MAHLPDAAEEILVTAARSAEPQVIKHLVVEIQRRVDQDGAEPSDEELRQPRNILRTRTKRNGRLEFHGDLDPEAGATLEMLLSPLAKPHPEGPDGPDERTLAERQGDAFVELLDLAHRSDGLPTEAGEPLHLYAVIDFEKMRDQVGYATLCDTVDVTARALRRMACTASIIPVVMDSESQVLDIGRQTRKLTVHIRRALHLRDRGCAFPACNRPPKHCDSHHLREWINGRETKIENLALLCRRHHRLIHHSQWEVAIINGIPVFYPPAFVDPQRRPMRNFLHAGAG